MRVEPQPSASARIGRPTWRVRCAYWGHAGVCWGTGVTATVVSALAHARAADPLVDTTDQALAPLFARMLLWWRDFIGIGMALAIIIAAGGLMYAMVMGARHPRYYRRGMDIFKNSLLGLLVIVLVTGGLTLVNRLSDDVGRGLPLNAQGQAVIPAP